MKCKGKFKFKEITKRDGGTFKNVRGDEITYRESYLLKVDEITEDGIYERMFKLPVDSPMINDLLITKPYTDITLEFDINFYGNNVRCLPVALVK